MSRPRFEFLANSCLVSDESGVAEWRYVNVRKTGNVEIVVRQEFPTLQAAYAMNKLLQVAWSDGEAEGYAGCLRKVMDALK